MHYNLINESMNCSMSVRNPEVGMCGTLFCGSDRYPVVVTEIIDRRTIRVDFLEDFDYEYSIIGKLDNNINYLHPNRLSHYMWNSDEGKGKPYTYRKNKRWIEMGKDMWSAASVHLGKADSYRDPNF